MLNEAMWLSGFIGSFSLLIVILIILWVSIRDYFDDKNKIDNLLFGGGLTLVAAAYLYRDAFSVTGVSFKVFLTVAIGFTLVGISLVKKKGQIFFLLFPPLVLFLPRQSWAFALSSILILMLAYLSLVNEEGFFCREECKNNHSSKDWFIIFVLFSFISGFHIASSYVSPAIGVYFAIISIVTRYIATILIFFHISKCAGFSKKEKYFFPPLFGFLIVMMLSGFVNTQLAIRREEKVLKESVMEETLSLKYITEREFGEEELIQKLSTKSVEMNDFLDKIYIRTGVRGVYFYKDERVASVPSAAPGVGRGLGTKINNKTVEQEVLEKGNNYAGKISKQGYLFVGGYAPIKLNGKVIGMVATGKLYESSKYFNRNLFARAIISGIVLMLFILWLFLAEKGIKKTNSLRK